MDLSYIPQFPQDLWPLTVAVMFWLCIIMIFIVKMLVGYEEKYRAGFKERALASPGPNMLFSYAKNNQARLRERACYPARLKLTRYLACLFVASSILFIFAYEKGLLDQRPLNQKFGSFIDAETTERFVGWSEIDAQQSKLPGIEKIEKFYTGNLGLCFVEETSRTFDTAAALDEAYNRAHAILAKEYTDEFVSRSGEIVVAIRKSEIHSHYWVTYSLEYFDYISHGNPCGNITYEIFKNKLRTP